MSIHSCILNVCFRETREYSRVLLIADHHPIDPGRHPLSNGDLADEVPSEQCVRVRGLKESGNNSEVTVNYGIINYVITVSLMSYSTTNRTAVM